MLKQSLTVRFALLAIACGLLSGCSRQQPRQVEKEAKVTAIHPDLKRLAAADPQVDLTSAVAQGDTRFRGIMGAGLIVPGVMNFTETNVYIIPDTQDAVRDQEHFKYQLIASDYAKAYNKLLLQHLKTNSAEAK
ncbi:MAG: hypothetical protein K0Q55_2079 [Verrucomicrobia bacterium]|jgi:hypothetical protein|nr:hypothetical protein [Verrucomicrobiota bacterium]